MFSKQYISASNEYKRKTINACKLLARRYRKPLNQIFFMADYDPLCKIYRTYNPETKFTCFGCFMADPYGKQMCIRFKSYKRAQSDMHEKIMLYCAEHVKKYDNPRIYHTCVVSKPCESMLKRAEFFDERIKEFENKPSWMFHPETKFNFNYKLNL